MGLEPRPLGDRRAAHRANEHGMRAARPLRRRPAAAAGAPAAGRVVRVRVLECPKASPGLPVPRQALSCLVQHCPGLKEMKSKNWCKRNGPFANVPMAAFRTLLFWASS